MSKTEELHHCLNRIMEDRCCSSQPGNDRDSFLGRICYNPLILRSLPFEIRKKLKPKSGLNGPPGSFCLTEAPSPSYAFALVCPNFFNDSS